LSRDWRLIVQGLGAGCPETGADPPGLVFFGASCLTSIFKISMIYPQYIYIDDISHV